MMNYLFALFVISALESGEFQYTRVGTYEARMSCEIALIDFEEAYDLHETQILACIKVDE